MTNHNCANLVVRIDMQFRRKSLGTHLEEGVGEREEEEEGGRGPEEGADGSGWACTRGVAGELDDGAEESEGAETLWRGLKRRPYLVGAPHDHR
ncbi:hypothetical protein B296_00002986 [Ensete ventricosum]|uniref:Uncharacterized protein n=1 Tax=Ensete ventricosum TaxID=4639 RepID=A0A427ASR6_ENSVE|nr:hypothetical protein B296_00002986 [Ensete ventricosum]